MVGKSVWRWCRCVVADLAHAVSVYLRSSAGRRRPGAAGPPYGLASKVCEVACCSWQCRLATSPNHRSICRTCRTEFVFGHVGGRRRCPPTRPDLARLPHLVFSFFSLFSRICHKTNKNKTIIKKIVSLRGMPRQFYACNGRAVAALGGRR